MKRNATTPEDHSAIDAATHRNALSTALALCGQANSSERMQRAAAQCQTLVESGIPCGSSPAEALEIFIAYKTPWPDAPELRDLFRRYVTMGLIDLDSPWHPTPPRPGYPSDSLPLEAALQLGNRGAFLAMVEDGADPGLIPGPFYARYSEVTDVYHFIRSRHAGAQGAEIAAKLTEIIMRRKVAEVLGETPRLADAAAPARRSKLL